MTMDTPKPRGSSLHRPLVDERDDDEDDSKGTDRSDRSDRWLLSPLRSPRDAAASCWSGFSRKLELAALAILFKLPKEVSSALLDIAYGRRVSAEGVGLETKTQVALRLGQVLGRRFDLIDFLRQDLRKGRKAFARMLSQPKHGGVRAEDVTISSAAPHHDIAARIYTPEALVGSDVPLPVLLYFHGGGWVLGGIDTTEGFLSSLAHWAKCAVVSVDYRLAPEHPFPAALEDAERSFEWAAGEAELRGWDPRKILVGGDSAGGNLAAALCQACVLRDLPVRPSAQVLLFPSLYLGPDALEKYPSIHLFGGDSFYALPFKAMAYFRDAYLGPAQDGLDPRVSPLLGSETVLSRLPPAYFGLCHFDVLRDEGRDYARRLRESGVPVELDEYRGHHGLLYLYGKVPYAKECLGRVARFLRGHMYPHKL